VQVALVGGDPAASPGIGRIEAGTRGALVRIARPPGDGPFRVTVKVKGAGAEINERLDVVDRPSPVLGEPTIYRATPAAQSPIRPVADYQFWRSERVHVEWPVDGPLDRREGRVLGRDGNPLKVPVQITEKERDGRAVVAADLGLAPLAPGDYVIEVVAARGATEATRYVPVRVVR